jgi:hypothetical protein
MGLGAFAKADSHRASPAPEVRKLRSGGVETRTALVAGRAVRAASVLRRGVLVRFFAGLLVRPTAASHSPSVEARLRANDAELLLLRRF